MQHRTFVESATLVNHIVRHIQTTVTVKWSINIKIAGNSRCAKRMFALQVCALVIVGATNMTSTKTQCRCPTRTCSITANCLGVIYIFSSLLNCRAPTRKRICALWHGRFDFKRCDAILHALYKLYTVVDIVRILGTNKTRERTTNEQWN